MDEFLKFLLAAKMASEGEGGGESGAHNCGNPHCFRNGKSGTVAVNPIALLRQAAKSPNKMTLDARLEKIDDAIRSLENNADKVSDASPEKVADALADLRKWRGVIAEIGKADTAADLSELIEEHWDSVSTSQVMDPAATHTGTAIRTAFKHAAQRKWFELDQMYALDSRKRHAADDAASSTSSKQAKTGNDENDRADGDADKPVDLTNE